MLEINYIIITISKCKKPIIFYTCTMDAVFSCHAFTSSEFVSQIIDSTKTKIIEGLFFTILIVILIFEKCI